MTLLKLPDIKNPEQQKNKSAKVTKRSVNNLQCQSYKQINALNPTTKPKSQKTIIELGYIGCSYFYPLFDLI